METEKLIPRVQPIQKSARKNKGPKIKKLIEIPSRLINDNFLILFKLYFIATRFMIFTDLFFKTSHSFVESIPSPKAKEKFVKSPKQDEGKEENQVMCFKNICNIIYFRP